MMFKDRWILFLCLLCFNCDSLLSQVEYLTYNKQQMELSKNLINKGNDPVARSAYRGLSLLADSIMNSKYFPRVTNKKLTSVSDDIHDYVSLATYYWPDKTKKGGIPYVPKDGKVNPEVAKVNNFSNLTRMSRAVNILGLAYYYTGNESYVKKATAILRVFFLNSETRMNPNMNHAQFIKGSNTGRIEGIIDSRFFINAIEGILLIKNSPNFLKKDYKGLQNWFRDFLNWMESSEIGKKGMKLTNNIGTAYHMQRIAYNSFLGNRNNVEKIVNNDLRNLLSVQFDREGRQKFELKRTLPFNYSVANLEYWATINNMCVNIKCNLRPFERSILETATNYLNSDAFEEVDRQKFTNYVKVWRTFSKESQFRVQVKSMRAGSLKQERKELSLGRLENMLFLN